MKQFEAIEQELQMIEKDNGGLLRPADVVSFAQDDTTALHGQFTWDDEEAGHQFRLVQARGIIRARPTILPQAEKKTRAYVSLVPDRKKPGGGYRQIESVLTDKERRAQLVDQTLREIRRILEKRQELRELADMWEALERTEQKAKAQKQTRIKPQKQPSTAYAGL
jgi:hypothetical protein